MLAHALRATWQQRHGHTLTVEGYRSTGGIHRAVATTADRVFAGLDPTNQHAARILFLRLIKIGDSTEDTRRRVARTDLLSGLDPSSVGPVVDATTSAFLAASTAQERRTARWRRAVLVVLSVLALVTSGAAVFAFQQRATAQSERDTAILNQITEEADRLPSTDLSLAAQLDLAAYRMRPTPNLYTTLITDANAVLSTPLTAHTSLVYAVAFSPDGRTLATGSADRTVRLWDMNIDHAIQRICATTTNTLNPGKWEQYVSKDLPYRPPCP